MLTPTRSYTQIWFTIKCMFPRYSHYTYNYTTVGLMKKYLKLFAKLGAVLLAASTIQAGKRAGVQHLDLQGWKVILRQIVARLLLVSSGKMREFAKAI